MESDDDQPRARFFDNQSYTSKQDIVQAVIRYNCTVNRPFRVISSDTRRYKAICTQDGCAFVVQFAFSQAFSPPTKFIRHSCAMSGATKSSRREATGKQIALNPMVREMLVTTGRLLRPVPIQKKLMTAGITASYMNCVRALRRLQQEFFDSDADQYKLLPAYVDELNRRGHRIAIELTNGVFKRVCVAFREGIEAYAPYHERGIAVDGTSLKTSIGGVLLVACFRNGNNEIQIVGVGVVAVENEGNWTWFLASLLPHLQPAPAFLISDRDKGLINAAKATTPGIPHFYCFRHLMENFNKKFKSKELKTLAWVVVRARTQLEYDRAAADLSAMSKNATKWLQEVGKEKWSTAYSPCPRFNTLTSNNVESVNSALRGIRSLPILDCLMEIERYVATKWMENTTKAENWGELTRYASRRADKALEHTVSGSIYANSSTSYVVEIKFGIGCIPMKFALQLCEGVVKCSCGYFEDVGAPCAHAMLALKHAGRLTEMTSFYRDSWKTSVFQNAYAERGHTTILPLVLKEALTPGECKAPGIPKKRGRPKKKRIPSQQASESLKKQIRRCGMCKQVGHNRKSCSFQAS